MGKHGKYRRSLEGNGEEVSLAFDGYLAGAVKKVEQVPDGKPMVSLLCTPDMVRSETVVLAMGETGMIGEMTAGFGTDANISITTDGNLFFIKSVMGLKSTVMQEMKTVEYPADSLVVLTPGVVYTIASYYNALGKKDDVYKTLVRLYNNYPESPMISEKNWLFKDFVFKNVRKFSDIDWMLYP